MKMRCLNPGADSYPAYGGRGIKVCERWYSFENFLEDMGECPDGFSIERKEVNGDYEKGNCAWASMEVQQNNKRNNRFIEYQGKTLTATQWERLFGLRNGTVLQRLRRGWPIDRIFERPRTCARSVA
ncbi:hypothetical protein BG61_16865 [Caballeronia glathei]|uniref:HNH endonuclease n=1 Tax=Caballeronia glathei TaxID=60547 RepID=A0A069PW26_9BURK|nr:hypothetical protein BG61_16865 [Caballeronia glathei]